MASSSTSNAPQPLDTPPTKKLKRTNYLLWKAQVMPNLRGARVLGLLEGKEKAPPEYLTEKKDDKETIIPNPAYDSWILKDQQVLSYLLNGLSVEIH